MKKINWTPEQEAEINRVQRTTGVTRKSAIRKMRAAAKVQAKVKAQAVKTTPKPQPQQKSAGVNRSEGIRLFKVAGRPTKEQFILVYGERGPKMTWEQRAAAGAPEGVNPMSGEPFNITFSRPIGDLESFLKAVFSGTEPFRLWGAPVAIGTNYFRVTALDLHVTNRITFEVARDFMRVYLPDGSCGNTIIRLYTNLQHYYDSQVSLTAGGGETLF